ncbi:MAG TPA: PilZ domain-containing protein, partial [Pyrinomonadaceae bacterium]|nr:PilZ domain-containing protein [Pyrinomonadaceae bacterium]
APSDDSEGRLFGSTIYCVSPTAKKASLAMTLDGKPQRMRERIKLYLPVRVMCREAVGLEWTEMTRLLDVTPFGAAFALSRRTEPGRLLHLTLAMPRQLRCFDHIEDQYRVWSLVRHVREAEPPQKAGVPKGTGLPRFEIGVAFVGKSPPKSFNDEPSTRYEIESLSAEGLWWEAREKDSTPANNAVPLRAEATRLSMPVEVTVEVFGEKGETQMSEQTVTENISRRGAAVPTTLSVERGQFVRLISSHHQLTITAVVRARRTGADGIARLHVEFVDRQWPLEGLE